MAMEPPQAPHIPTTTTPAPTTTTTFTPTSTPTTTATTAATTTTAATYPDSLDSSPRSRATDFDDSFPTTTTTSKLRLMCSYGGHIVPRPHDKSLCYVGGDTRIVVVDRSSTLPDLLSRLSKTLLNGRPFTLKYQLPNEDLDSLITVSSEEDLDNMVDEYDRLIASNPNPLKPSRIRLFLFPVKPEGASSIGSILDGSNRSEDWFLNALNGSAALERGFSDPSSVNCLLGLEENNSNHGLNGISNTNHHNNNSSSTDLGAKEGSVDGGSEAVTVKLGKSNPDIHSVPDSPIIETTSSFGSTSSSPSLANLPPIRVHVEENNIRVLDQRVGIEEQFAQMGIGVVNQNQKPQQQQQQQQVVVDDGFVVLSSPPQPQPGPGMVGGVPMMGGGEFAGRVYSDDERSDHGVPVGYRKVQQQPQQPQMGQAVMSSQAQQQKQMASGELLSPDSVSSDSSFSAGMPRQKPLMYQEPVVQMSSGSNRLPPNLIDPNTRVQMQPQVSETVYALPPQYEQHQQQLLQQQQQQHHHQQQQQLQQQQQVQQQQGQAQPQQYIPAGAHFVQHPGGAVPLVTYYQVYPPQQPQHHHPHQYPVYYVSSGQPQPYGLPVQQQQPPNMGEPTNPVPQNRPQTPPNPTTIPTSSAYNQPRNVAPPKPDMTGVYRTAASPQLVQVPSNQAQPQPQPQAQAQAQHQPQAQSQSQTQAQQQQFMGYSQVHHPSQSIAPSSGANASYGYEFSDPAHAQIYYTQPLAPTLAAQYQAVTSGAPMVMPDGSSPHANDNLKQQIRSSQPL